MPWATAATYSSFTAEAYVVAGGFKPGRVGELVFTAIFLFEEVGVEDLWGFGFVVDGIDLFEGKGISVSEDDA
jgi:hypothetical protein